MFPHERSLVKELAGQPFALVGVNSDKTPEDVRKQSLAEQITWPTFFDGGTTRGPIASRFGVRGWPTIYVIDKKGVIRFVNVRNEAMSSAVKKLLAE